MNRPDTRSRTLGQPLRLASAALLSALAFGIAQAQTESTSRTGQEFRDWTVQCEQPEGAEREHCHIFQTVVLRENNQPLLHLAVGRIIETGDAAAIMTVPLGVLLPPGMALRVDEGENIRFPVQSCQPNGCIAVLPLEDEMIRQLKGGVQATVTFVDADQRPIGVPVSLLGFTAGFDSL